MGVSLRLLLGYFGVSLGATLGVTLGLFWGYLGVNLGLFCGCFGYREAIIFLSVLFLHFIIYRTKNMVGQPFATCGFTKGLQWGYSGVTLGTVKVLIFVQSFFTIANFKIGVPLILFFVNTVF